MHIAAAFLRSLAFSLFSLVLIEHYLHYSENDLKSVRVLYARVL